jgi:hypothetical protein
VDFEVPFESISKVQLNFRGSEDCTQAARLVGRRSFLAVSRIRTQLFLADLIRFSFRLAMAALLSAALPDLLSHEPVRGTLCDICGPAIDWC